MVSIAEQQVGEFERCNDLHAHVLCVVFIAREF